MMNPEIWLPWFQIMDPYFWGVYFKWTHISVCLISKWWFQRNRKGKTKPLSGFIRSWFFEPILTGFLWCMDPVQWRGAQWLDWGTWRHWGEVDTNRRSTSAVLAQNLTLCFLALCFFCAVVRSKIEHLIMRMSKIWVWKLSSPKSDLFHCHLEVS